MLMQRKGRKIHSTNQREAFACMYILVTFVSKTSFSYPNVEPTYLVVIFWINVGSYTSSVYIA